MKSDAELALDEIQFHIDALNTIILGISMDVTGCGDILRTLNFALGSMREKRQTIISLIENEKLFMVDSFGGGTNHESAHKAIPVRGEEEL